MGKLRRSRRKLHNSANKTSPSENVNRSDSIMPMMVPPSDNLFAGIDINLEDLNKNLKINTFDDLTSIKSFKSMKSETSQYKTMTKSNKLKLKKELFLRKLDAVKQSREDLKTSKKKKKRKGLPFASDTNVQDTLSSLETVLKCQFNKKVSTNEDSHQQDVPMNIFLKSKPTVKSKAIQKSSKRKKTLLRDIEIYKQLLRNKVVSENPLSVVTEHVKAMAEQSLSSN